MPDFMDYSSSLDPNTNPFDLHFADKLPVSLYFVWLISTNLALSVQFLPDQKGNWEVHVFFLFVIQKREVSDSASADLARKWLVKDEVSYFIEHLVCNSSTSNFTYVQSISMMVDR